MSEIQKHEREGTLWMEISLTCWSCLLLTTAHSFCGPCAWEQLVSWSSEVLERRLQSPRSLPATQGPTGGLSKKCCLWYHFRLLRSPWAGPGPLCWLSTQVLASCFALIGQWHWVLNHGIVLEWLSLVLRRLGLTVPTESMRDKNTTWKWSFQEGLTWLSQSFQSLTTFSGAGNLWVWVQEVTSSSIRNFHKEFPRLSLLPSHFVGSGCFLLGLSCHTSFYENILVVKIKSWVKDANGACDVKAQKPIYTAKVLMLS